MIELVVAVAVLAIIASFALPAYSDFKLRADVAKAISVQQEALFAMTQYHQKRKRFVSNNLSTNQRNMEVGLKGKNDYNDGTIRSMWVGSEGVQGKNDTSAHIATMFVANPKLANNTPRLLSTIEFINGRYEFICNNPASKYGAAWNNIDEKYLPASCRQD